MPKLILSMMISLDHRYAGADGSLDWFLSDTQFEEEMLGLLRNVDGMIFGRVSYGLLAQYWPIAGTPQSGGTPGDFTSKQRESEFAHLMNTVPKIVYSRTLREAAWGPVTIVKKLDAADVERRKRSAGKDLVLFAGGHLAAAFAQLDLFDEYRLMIHPTVRGQGPVLFDGLATPRQLKLQRTRTFSSGVVLVEYGRG